MMRFADLFCGGGGMSAGAVATGEAEVVFGLNHWDIAIKTHSANFTDALHVNSRLENTSPSECPRIDMLFAAPECTHHSRARGGKPTSDQQRSGAWHVLPWVEHHRPSWVVIENVVEFKQWGPIGADGTPLKSKQGNMFAAWVKSLESIGYKVDHRELNAADFGAATSRNRLFVIARKGNRNPVFPEPTHSRSTGGELPGMRLQPWKAASTAIDWSIPCPSIFGRKRPLADKTLLRIEAGIRRFVGPFIAQWDNQSGGAHVRDVKNPLFTMTTKANMGLVTPFALSTGSGGAPRSVAHPLPTIVTCDGTALVAPFLADVNHGGRDHRSYRLSDPLGTVTAKNGKALILPWLGHYYGTDNQSPISDPLDTITTKGRHSLCVAVCRGPQDWPSAQTDAMRLLQSTMRKLGLCDIGFRMLSNPELAAAQGFDPGYIFHGSKAEVTRQVGNSVSPAASKAITRAILSV